VSIKQTPPLSDEIDAPNGGNNSNRKRKCHIGHTSPKGLRQGLNKLMNQILACDDPLSHAGQYASLANAMTNSQKFSMEIGDWKKIQDRINAIEKQMTNK